MKTVEIQGVELDVMRFGAEAFQPTLDKNSGVARGLFRVSSPELPGRAPGARLRIVATVATGSCGRSSDLGHIGLAADSIKKRTLKEE